MHYRSFSEAWKADWLLSLDPRCRLQFDQCVFQIVDHTLRVRHAAATGGDAEVDIPEIRHLGDVHRHAVDGDARGIHDVEPCAVPVHMLARTGAVRDGRRIGGELVGRAGTRGATLPDTGDGGYDWTAVGGTGSE